MNERVSVMGWELSTLCTGHLPQLPLCSDTSDIQLIVRNTHFNPLPGPMNAERGVHVWCVRGAHSVPDSMVPLVWGSFGLAPMSCSEHAQSLRSPK